MAYDCYNKIGERIGIAYTKREAEEMIRRANWELDRIRGTSEYEQRVMKAQRIQQQEMKGASIGLIAGLIFLIIGVIIAISNA
jgi:hypothetical protein